MQAKKVTRKVVLEGFRPIMFDRYAGDNKTELMPEQKFYFNDNDEICMPAINIMSFLCAINSRSAVKLNYDVRKYKPVAEAILGFSLIEPEMPRILRNGKPVKFNKWGEDGISLHKSVARLKGGIPNPKERPMLDAPWSIEFDYTLFPNDTVSDIELKNIFGKGGMVLGLGTYRGVFGKFEVKSWK